MNILPFDDVVNYLSTVLNRQVAHYYFEKLLDNIQWKNDKVTVFGKRIITNPNVASENSIKAGLKRV